jgi:4-hydroxy-4-methyl-2-oxoglutarate aldolase
VLTPHCPSVSAIADVLALWGLDGWLTPPLRPMVAASAPRIGHVRTVAMTVGPTGRGLSQIYGVLSQDLTDCFVVVAGAGDVPGAVWGELLTLAADQQHAAGALIDGWVRDRTDMTTIGLPVYALGEAVAGPQAVAHIAGVDVDVRIGSVDVSATDFVVVDDSGAVRIAADQVADVIDAARRYGDAERLVAQALHDGEPLSSAYHHKKTIVDELRR